MRVDFVSSTSLPSLRDDGAAPRATHAAGVRNLEVTINAATRQFEAGVANGSMRNAMVGSLDAVDGLTTAIRPDGRLVLVTDDARQLVITKLMTDVRAGPVEPAHAASVTADPVSAYLDTGAEGPSRAADETMPGELRPR